MKIVLMAEFTKNYELTDDFSLMSPAVTYNTRIISHLNIVNKSDDSHNFQFKRVVFKKCDIFEK
jgi:hypothetical protein